MSHTLHTGDSAQLLKQYPDNHFDSIITDPPYGIEFLGKEWDSNTGAVAIWQECFRVLKPGGHLLAFSAARTYHHLATNIESVGFEIRDQIMWIYSSGFPKAQDMGKSIHKRANKETSYTIPAEDIDKLIKIEGDLYQHPAGYRVRCLPNTKGSGAADQYGGNSWNKTYERVVDVDNDWRGWKTALKPAHEPIVMARKPFKGSTIDNVLQHGVGALNIDATRIMYEDEKDLDTYVNNIKGPLERSTAIAGDNIGMHESKTGFKVQKGKVKRPQAGHRTASFSFGHKETQPGGDGSPEFEANPQGRYPSNVVGDIADYQKYFYCPKVSRKERHCGFEQDQIPDPLANYSQGDVKNHPLWDPSIGTNIQRLKHKILEHNKTLGQQHQVQGAVGNNHPTVKPVALMRYLVQLVTPTGSTVLDPFMGSGTTGMAARELGHRFVGCDLDPKYVEIAERRIQGWLEQHTASTRSTETRANWDRWFEQ